MKKYLIAIFPFILCAIPSYAAQWSCPTCTQAEYKALFEKYATGDKLSTMMQTFNANLSNGVLNAKGVARTCIATWGRNSKGTEAYKKCENFANDLIRLAKSKLPQKANADVLPMSQCEATVRNNLPDKSQAAIRDMLVKQCQFMDISTYDKITVSVKHAVALTEMVNQKNCRIDNVYNLLICQNKYMYAFGGLNGSGKISDKNYRDNIAKAVCNASAGNPGNRDIMSFDDNVKGCPTPQAVKTCGDYQKLLQKIDSSLVAKEHKEYAQNYCIVAVETKQSEATYVAHLKDFANEEGSIDMAIQKIETVFPKLSCSYYDWYDPETGIYSVKCDETKTTKKGPQAHGFRFKKLWCFGDDGEYEYDPKIAGCKVAPEKPDSTTCNPQIVDAHIFSDASVMPLQAIALSQRYIMKQCKSNEYDCRGKMPNGNNVSCGGIDMHFASIDNFNQGNKANSSIAKGICKMHRGTPRYTNNEEFVVCEGLGRSVCESSMRGERDILNESIAVEFNTNTNQCVFYWGNGKSKFATKAKAIYNEFNNIRVTPSQAVALVQRFNDKKNGKIMSGCHTSGNQVECSDGIYPFASLSESNGGNSANHGIARALCDIHGGAGGYKEKSSESGECWLTRAKCEGDFGRDVRVVNSSIAIVYNDNGACTLGWGGANATISGAKTGNARIQSVPGNYNLDFYSGIGGTNAVQKVAPKYK